MSVINARMNILKDEIVGYGVKKVARVDKEADDKFIDKLEDGTLQPYHDYDDLIKCCIAMLGRCLGYQGGKEIASTLWKDFTFEP